MKIKTISDLTTLVYSGRIDSILIVRSPRRPEIVKIRMRRGNRWDELWMHSSTFEPGGNGNKILQDALKTILDQVSPG